MDISLLVSILGSSVALIIGLTLVSLGYFGHHTRIQLAGWGIAAIAFVTLVNYSPSFRDQAYFFVTFFLVVAAFLSILFANQRVKRDRTERYLDEVSTWLRELESLVFQTNFIKPSKDFFGDIELYRKFESEIPPGELHIIRELLDRTIPQATILRVEISKGEYTQKLALKLNKDLGSLLGIVLDHLKQRRQYILHRPINFNTAPEEDDEKEHKLIHKLLKDNTDLTGVTLSEKGRSIVLVGRNANDIRESIVNAIDKTIEIKINLLES